MKDPQGRPTVQYIPSFGKCRSRGLSDQEKALLQSMQHLFIEDAALLSSVMQPIYCEIGFGSGEHLINWRDSTNEDGGLLVGCEPYLNGIIKLLNGINTGKIENIRIWQGDGRLLLTKLPNHSIDGIYLLFPDPWPKRKHHKRRILNHETLCLIHSKLANERNLIMATDIFHYAMEMEKNISRDMWDLTTAILDGVNDCIKYNILTRYARKAISEGRQIHFFSLKKKNISIGNNRSI